MSDVPRNVTAAKEGADCQYRDVSVVLVLAIDVFTVLIGQPAVARLLWLAVTSKRPTDVLNLNLALFLNSQYLLATLHFVFFFTLPDAHQSLIKGLVVYVQIGGPMSLLFISVERYVAVRRPTSYALLKTYRLREAASAAVWLISSIVTAVVAFTNEHTPHHVKRALMAIPLGVMLLTTHTMAYCSFHISRALKKAGPGQDRLHPAKRRAFVTVCATTSITLCCYVPVSFIQNATLHQDPKSECLITAVIIIFLSVASVVHPLFYLHTHGQLLTCRVS